MKNNTDGKKKSKELADVCITCFRSERYVSFEKILKLLEFL